MKKSIAHFCLCFIVLILASCSLVETNETGASLGVKYVTMKFIIEHPEYKEKTCEISGDAKTFFDDKKLPIMEIEKLIRDKIDFTELDVADAMLVDALILLIVDQINQDAIEGLIDEKTQVTASKIFGWIQSVSC